MFSISILTRAGFGLGVLRLRRMCRHACEARRCPAPQSFYTVTAEIALARHRTAGRGAAICGRRGATSVDPALLQRAAEVAAETLQPTLAEQVRRAGSSSIRIRLDAQRAAARAALALYKIDDAAARLSTACSRIRRWVRMRNSRDLETDLSANDNIFGARQVADRLAALFPASPAALRVQGLAALRADDPAAAVVSLQGALDAVRRTRRGRAPRRAASCRRRWPRARILAGDVEEPLRRRSAARSTRTRPPIVSTTRCC